MPEGPFSPTATITTEAKISVIICAGSLAVWWIIIPGMSAIWGDNVLNAWNPEITSTVGLMSPEEIFKYYAKSIGIDDISQTKHSSTGVYLEYQFCLFCQHFSGTANTGSKILVPPSECLLSGVTVY